MPQCSENNGKQWHLTLTLFLPQRRVHPGAPVPTRYPFYPKPVQDASIFHIRLSCYYFQIPNSVIACTVQTNAKVVVFGCAKQTLLYPSLYLLPPVELLKEKIVAKVITDLLA